MAFLKQLLDNVFQNEISQAKTNSFQQVTREELESHLSISRYGNFELTGAIRPSFDLKVRPQEAFRRDFYRDPQNDFSIPVVIASVSREKLYDLFLDLLDPLGPVVDVVLESSHNRQQSRHSDYLREGIDLPVLKSVLYDYEDLLLNDGCTGIAVMNSRIPQEIQFDEHKLLLVYGESTGQSESIFNEYRIPNLPDTHFLTEAEHIHSSRNSYRLRFEELKSDLGIDE